MHAEAVLPAETHEILDTPCPALPKRKMIAHEQVQTGRGSDAGCLRQIDPDSSPRRRG